MELSPFVAHTMAEQNKELGGKSIEKLDRDNAAKKEEDDEICFNHFWGRDRHTSYSI